MQTWQRKFGQHHGAAAPAHFRPATALAVTAATTESVQFASSFQFRTCLFRMQFPNVLIFKNKLLLTCPMSQPFLLSRSTAKYVALPVSVDAVEAAVADTTLNPPQPGSLRPQAASLALALEAGVNPVRASPHEQLESTAKRARLGSLSSAKVGAQDSPQAVAKDQLSIVIKTLAGRAFALAIDPRETVLDVKSALFKRDPAMEVPRQVLFHSLSNEAALDDSILISSCSLAESSEFIVVVGDVEKVTFFRFAKDVLETTGRKTIVRELHSPRFLAFDQSRDRLLISDHGGHCVLMLEAYSLAQVWRYGGAKDDGDPRVLCAPTGCAFSADGAQVYVADSGNKRILTLSASDGRLVASFGSVGSAAPAAASGVGAQHDRFAELRGVAVSPLDGLVWVADAGKNIVQCFDASQPRWSLVKHVGGVGRRGLGDQYLSAPTSVALTNDNRLIVADSGNCRVQVFDTSSCALQRSLQNVECEWSGRTTRIPISSAFGVCVAGDCLSRIATASAHSICAIFLCADGSACPCSSTRSGACRKARWASAPMSTRTRCMSRAPIGRKSQSFGGCDIFSKRGSNVNLQY